MIDLLKTNRCHKTNKTIEDSKRNVDMKNIKKKCDRHYRFCDTVSKPTIHQKLKTSCQKVCYFISNILVGGLKNY